MTHIRPVLVSGPESVEGDPARAVAVLRFPRREMSWLGEVSSAAYMNRPGAVREEELADQAGFAARPLSDALRSSRPIVRHLLEQIAESFERSTGPRFDPARLFATVRVDRRSRYRQLQGAHIDWTRGTEFDMEEWDSRCTSPERGRTLSSLARCHSVDCVLGGPPTEYFLDEHQGRVFLTRRSRDSPWTITDIDFPEIGTPQAGVTAAFVHRPPFTIHQFPSPWNWRSDHRLRLFLSCDYWT